MTESPFPDESTKTCEIKSALLREYQSATMEYSDAVLALNPMIGSRHLHDALFLHADQAELRVTAARRELEKHIAAHGC
jgi:hypothetical protein